jgi:hypothetical protein
MLYLLSNSVVVKPVPSGICFCAGATESSLSQIDRGLAFLGSMGLFPLLLQRPCSRAEWYARHASTSAALATRILSAELAETEPPVLIAANSSPWSVIRRFEQSVHSRISLSRLWYWPRASIVGLPLRRIRAIGVPRPSLRFALPPSGRCLAGNF